MGVAGGPNIERDGLVFGYDTGYSSEGKNLSRGRYFNGPASTNILEVLNPTYTNSQNANFYAVSGEEEVFIPSIGKRSVKYVEYFNNRYGENGNVNSGTTCCPNLFYYHSGHIDAEASTTYTYSIIYKHTNNYTHPNFMYRYERTSDNTYIKEGGLHSTASDRRTPLGNGWYHAWGSFTTTATTARFYCYSFLYNYGTTKHKFYVAAISLVKNVSGDTHFIIPPHLMLEPNTSISSTNSLIDLTKSTTIDVSNVSFDSDGSPTFDGTDDYINLNSIAPLIAGGDFSLEAVIKGPTQDHKGIIPINTSTGGNRALFLIRNASMGIYDGGTWYIGNIDVDDNNWHHVTLSYTRSTRNAVIYVDGEVSLNTTTGNTITVASDDRISIGQEWDGASTSDHFNGKIPIAKIYNRALTAQEVQQNYKAYKNRFNI